MPPYPCTARMISSLISRLFVLRFLYVWSVRISDAGFIICFVLEDRYNIIYSAHPMGPYNPPIL
jgi:hypothetical protein